MKFYIDSEFRLHITNADDLYKEIILSEKASDFFDGKCQTFIEGYRFVPSGESWTRSDGVDFHGEMIAPWKDYNELDAAQREYERQLLAEYESALAEIEKALGV
jgi:hypothetical protein